MPEFVKSIPSKKGYYEVRKVKHMDSLWVDFEKGFEWRVDECLPATREEYEVQTVTQ